jgi:hypothetical protein
MHVIIWEFTVKPEKVQDFIAAYKTDGDWAQLFGGGPRTLRHFRSALGEIQGSGSAAPRVNAEQKKARKFCSSG